MKYEYPVDEKWRGFDLISDALPFGSLWYTNPTTLSATRSFAVGQMMPSFAFTMKLVTLHGKHFVQSVTASRRFNYVGSLYDFRCSLQVSLGLRYGRFFVTNLRTATCNISPYSGMFYAAKSGMKTPTKILLALTAAAALSIAHPASANLITNPGFETGDFPPWTFTGSALVVFGGFGVPPHSGLYEAFLPGNCSLSQSVATTPGASYTINFFLALAESSGTNSFSVSWGGVTIPGSVLTNQGNFGYTEYTFNVTGSAGASTALQFHTTIVGAWFLDDVSVNPAGVGVPDAGSTLPLLGFALLGLAALRRKLSC